MMEFSVFLSNTLVIDKTLWKLWLLGLTIDQTIQFLKEKKHFTKVLVLSQVCFKNSQKVSEF